MKKKKKEEDDDGDTFTAIAEKTIFSFFRKNHDDEGVWSIDKWSSMCPVWFSER